MEKCTESSDTVDEAIENNVSDAKECEDALSHGPNGVDSPEDNMQGSTKVEKAPAVKEESLKPNPKERPLGANKGVRYSMGDYLDYCTKKIGSLRIEPEDNIKESHTKSFLTVVSEKQSKCWALKAKQHPQLQDLLAHILQWKPIWLEDHEVYSTPPPVVDNSRLTAMLPTYRSFEHYYEIVEPLAILEMWHSIVEDYKEVRRKLKTFFIIPHSIKNLGCSIKKNVSTLTLEIAVPEPEWSLKLHPSKGDLLCFNYLSRRSDRTGSLKHKVFAYVTEVIAGSMPFLDSSNRTLFAKVKCPRTALTITAMTKALDISNIQMDRIHTLQKITYLQSNIRKVQALQQLHRSPLMNIILHPKIEDCQLVPANDVERYCLVTKNRLNTKQLEAVMRVTETVTQKLPKICLIQGPPGTGKSKVIVNLIMQILHDNRSATYKSKILVCAPSNAAIDEIVLRLLEMQKSLAGRNHFSLVRVGRLETMHKEVQAVSFQTRCEQLRRRGYDSWPVANRVLEGSDVIASTLSSSYTNQMESVFRGNPYTKFVCIIDEATQCTEPESLIPLMLNVRTLVLVGDPKQLPATVLSQKAKRLGLDQSLFARIERLFEGAPNNPIIQLNVQYRMPVPIALFPNHYFYHGLLENAATTYDLPFERYRVLNHDSTQDRGKFSNSGEADFVANLIYTMILARINYDGETLPVKVGIITPYKDQKKVMTQRIKNCLEHVEDTNKVEYEVNTVDSFQGQERDVIIMSCVRSNGIGFLSDRHRICVALTRAKHSLIICGNFKTFKKDPMWNALLANAKSRGVYVNVKSNAAPVDIGRHIIR